MSNPFSTFYHVVQLPCFAEESTYGTAYSGSYTFIAPQAAFIPEFDVGAIASRSIGSRDVRAIVDGAHIGGFTLRFNPYNNTFLKYVFNTGSGTGSVTGTIDKSLTIATKITISGSDYVMYIPGVKVERATLNVAVGGLVQAECYCIGHMPLLSGSDSGIITWPTDPGTAPWSFKDGGANPITVNGVGYNIATIRAAVRNNLTPIFTLGTQNPIQMIPMERQIQMVWSMPQATRSLYDLATGSVSHTTVWRIATGGPTITLSGSKLTRLLNLPYVVGSVAAETWGVETKTAFLTDT